MIDEVKAKVENLFGFELIPVFDTRTEEGCEDEVLGHYVTFEAGTLIPLDESIEQPVINIYEGGEVQFFHDATPHPVQANTPQEAREMSMTLCPCPVQFEQLQGNDFDLFAVSLIEDFQGYGDE
jgi:hypothetical protein